MKIGLLLPRSFFDNGAVLRGWALKAELEAAGHRVLTLGRWPSAAHVELFDCLAARSLAGYLKAGWKFPRVAGNPWRLVRFVKTLSFVRRELNPTAYHFSDWKDAPADLGVERLVVAGQPGPDLLDGAPKISTVVYGADKLSDGSSPVDPVCLVPRTCWLRLHRKVPRGSRSRLVVYIRSRQLLNALNLLDEFGDEAGWEVDVVVDADSPFDPKTCRDFVRLVKAFRPYSHLHLKLADGPQDFLCLFANASGCVTDHRLGVYLSSVFDLDCRALKTSDNEQTFGEIDAFAADMVKGRLVAPDLFAALKSISYDPARTYRSSVLSARAAASRADLISRLGAL